MAQIKLRETAAQVDSLFSGCSFINSCCALCTPTQFHFSVVVDNFGDKYEKYGGEATRIVATYYQLMRFCSAPNKVIKDVLEKFSM